MSEKQIMMGSGACPSPVVVRKCKDSAYFSCFQFPLILVPLIFQLFHFNFEVPELLQQTLQGKEEIEGKVFLADINFPQSWITDHAWVPNTEPPH